jgi:ubiquitin-protein ligase E3 C
MFSFNGDYKRSPIQSLGGRSVETDRTTLIKNAQVERKRREEIRKKEISSLKIQSLFRQVKNIKIVIIENCIIIVSFFYYRSYNQRQSVKDQERLVYESYLKTNGLNNFVDLEFLLKRLLYFYELNDGEKLVSCEHEKSSEGHS